MKEEIWKTIDGYDGRYQVSSHGRIRTLDWKRTGQIKIMSPNVGTDGYNHINLCSGGKQHMYSVHRLVAQAFISNPLNLETVNHKDENRTNNHVENLEWLSRNDNNRYGNHDLNSARTHHEKLIGCKAVVQVDSNGEIIQEFNSETEAFKATGAHHICDVCSGKRNSAGGFIWKYKSDF